MCLTDIMVKFSKVKCFQISCISTQRHGREHGSPSQETSVYVQMCTYVHTHVHYTYIHIQACIHANIHILHTSNFCFHLKSRWWQEQVVASTATHCPMPSPSCSVRELLIAIIWALLVASLAMALFDLTISFARTCDRNQASLHPVAAKVWTSLRTCTRSTLWGQ